MSRPRRMRRVAFQPDITYFKPAGIRMTELEETNLTIAELESIRLKEVEELDQETAAKKMDISQPTFHRLLLSSRKKIADALVNGKAIRIEGGNFRMAQPRGGKGFVGPAGDCICSKCDYKELKTRGLPCSTKKCPECGALLIRGE